VAASSINVNFRPYLVAFRLALSKALVYRANLLLGAINVLIWFGTLILIYRAVGGPLGSYSEAELVTYILATSLMAATLFNTSTQEQIANEIVEGDLVNFLLRPINYFFYWVARSLAVRAVFLVIAIASVFILSQMVADDLLIPTDPRIIAETLLLAAGSVVLMTILDFIAASFSFWTERGFGPRWMFMICARFLSGAAFPIALMPGWAQMIFNATPFPYLVGAPANAAIGKLDAQIFWPSLVTQWSWILVALLALGLLWRQGIKSYAAYGS
jgi:ABC-2 type transport system permease protein